MAILYKIIELSVFVPDVSNFVDHNDMSCFMHFVFFIWASLYYLLVLGQKNQHSLMSTSFERLVVCQNTDFSHLNHLSQFTKEYRRYYEQINICCFHNQMNSKMSFKFRWESKLFKKKKSMDLNSTIVPSKYHLFVNSHIAEIENKRALHLFDTLVVDMATDKRCK